MKNLMYLLSLVFMWTSIGCSSDDENDSNSPENPDNPNPPQDEVVIWNIKELKVGQETDHDLWVINRDENGKVSQVITKKMQNGNEVADLTKTYALTYSKDKVTIAYEDWGAPAECVIELNDKGFATELVTNDISVPADPYLLSHYKVTYNSQSLLQTIAEKFDTEFLDLIQFEYVQSSTNWSNIKFTDENGIMTLPCKYGDKKNNYSFDLNLVNYLFPFNWSLLNVALIAELFPLSDHLIETVGENQFVTQYTYNDKNEFVSQFATNLENDNIITVAITAEQRK